MLKIKEFFELVRWKQTLFKNSVILIPFIFAIDQFIFTSFLKDLILILLGFLCLSLISSSSYVINDIKDYEKDKNHSKKKFRPIASGKVSIRTAVVIAFLLFISGFFLTLYLSIKYSVLFLVTILFLFIFSLLYTFYFREIVFFDIIIISLNFVLRALAGLFLINVKFSYWIILSTFFLSLFMVSKKRICEIEYEKTEKYRPCYNEKHRETLKLVIFASITSVIVFFCVYSIFLGKPLLLISLPIALYLVFEYHNSSDKVIESESFIFEKKTLLLLFIWGLIVILALLLSK